MLAGISRRTVSPLWGINRNGLLKNVLCVRAASTIPPGIVGRNKRVLPAHMYKPRPKWETGERWEVRGKDGVFMAVILGDIDPYPNFDLSKIPRPGFENSDELKTFVKDLRRSEWIFR